MSKCRSLLLILFAAGLASCVGPHPEQAPADDLATTYRKADSYSQPLDASAVRGSQTAVSGGTVKR